MFTMKSLKENNLTVANASDILLIVNDYCGDNCEGCIFKSCLRDKLDSLYGTFISSVAESFGLEYGKPFKIKPVGSNEGINYIEGMEFVLDENDCILVNDGSGDVLNCILDFLIEGDFEVVSND